MRKLCYACASFAAGVFISELLLSPSARFFLVPVLFLCALLSLHLPFQVKKRIILVFLTAAIGVSYSAYYRRIVREPAETMAGEEKSIDCIVMEYPTLSKDYSSVVVKLTGDGLPSVRCRLSNYGEHWLDDLIPGDVIHAQVRFSSAGLLAGEESESYYSKNIYLRGTLLSEPLNLGGTENNWRFLPRKWHHAMVKLAQEIFPQDVSSFQTALLSGDKTSLYNDYELYYSLSHAGLMHIAAVSGMHVSFLVGTVQLISRNKKRTAALLFPLLLAFAALMGFTPSVSRAVFMQVYLLAAPLLNRENDSPTSLAVVLAVLLLQNPSAVSDISLQLSFASTAGILLLTPRIMEILRAHPEKRGTQSRLQSIRYWAVSSFSVTIGALAFTTPIMALRFGSVSVLSPLTNLLCLWVISILFSFGFAAILIGSVLPTVGCALGWALAWGDRYIFMIARWITALPLSVVYIQNNVYTCWLCAVYALAIVYALLRKKGKRQSMIPCILLSFILLCFAWLTVRFSRSDDMRVSVLDVGQGQSVFIEQNGTSILIDCGDNGTTGQSGQTAAYYTLSRNYSRIDALILTHLHRDHANGVARFLSLVDVDRIILPLNTSDPDGILQEIQEVAARKGTDILYISEETSFSLGHLSLYVLPPLMSEEKSENENSMIVQITCGDRDVVITGDATASAERRFAAKRDGCDAEVLVVGHHGSKTSTDERFLSAFSFDTAVISVGYNSYGHPSEETLERLSEAGVAIRRTDKEGNITLIIPSC